MLNVDEKWWIQRHKLNMKDFLEYTRLYLVGEYPEYLFRARLKDYEREYGEAESN